jgi:hypothetical protein
VTRYGDTNSKTRYPSYEATIPTCNGWSYGIKEYGIEVTFVITSIQNFIQIHQSVQKLHTRQKFKCPPFWSDQCHLQYHHFQTKFHEIHQSVQKLLGGFFTSTSDLNVCHFGMVEATGLKMWLQGHLQWHPLPTNPLISSKVTRGDTDRQASDLTCLLSFLNKWK